MGSQYLGISHSIRDIMYTIWRYLMTKYYYTCEEDKRLIEKSFHNIAYIIFGKKNSDKINTFEEFWKKMVSNINVFPQGSLHDRINHSTPGICRLDDKTKKIGRAHV